MVVIQEAHLQEGWVGRRGYLLEHLCVCGNVGAFC